MNNKCHNCNNRLHKYITSRIKRLKLANYKQRLDSTAKYKISKSEEMITSESKEDQEMICLSVSPCVCLPTCLHVCLSVCPSVCLPECLFVCLSVCPCVCLFVCSPVCLCVCPPVCQCVCLSVCPSVSLPACLSVYLSVNTYISYTIHYYSLRKKSASSKTTRTQEVPNYN